jgi:hypothetical protein
MSNLEQKYSFEATPQQTIYHPFLKVKNENYS